MVIEHIKTIKTKEGYRTSYDCPFCDYLLHIFTNKKGEVLKVKKGELVCKN